MSVSGICCAQLYRAVHPPVRLTVPAPALATALTVRVNHTNDALVELVGPLPGGLRVRPGTLPVRVWWDAAARNYVAGEEALRQWCGVGASQTEALVDLGEVLAEVFSDLGGRVDQLGPALRADFETLSQVITYADQSA